MEEMHKKAPKKKVVKRSNALANKWNQLGAGFNRETRAS